MPGFGALGQWPLGDGVGGTPFSWYADLSQPQMRRAPLRPGAHQFLAFAPNPVVSFGWMEPLSEPQRHRQGLRADAQQAFAFQPSPSPFVATGWYGWLSEPVRFPAGLKASLQQTTAWPPKLLPTPTITAVLDATETKDTMAAGVTLWNQPTTAEIGVVDTSAFGTEIGIQATGPSGTIASVKVSIRMT